MLISLTAMIILLCLSCFTMCKHYVVHPKDEVSIQKSKEDFFMEELLRGPR